MAFAPPRLGPHAAAAPAAEHAPRRCAGVLPLAGRARAASRLLQRSGACPRAPARRRRVAASLSGTQPALAAPCVETWTWRGHRISYERFGAADGSSAPPLVIVHGFGSSARHFRRLTSALSQHYTVYAPDLLGFGASAKPAVEYTPRLWAAQTEDFLRDVVAQPAVLVGNSIGSQVAVVAAADAPQLVRGLCLLNVAAGMNQRGLYGDSALLAAMAPLFKAVEWLLRQPKFARSMFNAFRSKANVEKILREQVYKRPSQVDDTLVDLLYAPSEDPDALGVFVEVFTGDPGPRPEVLAAGLDVPIKVIWGAEDAWTPVDGTVAEAFKTLAVRKPEAVEFAVIPRCGHVPFDDCPEEVVQLMRPWLSRFSSAEKS